MQFLVIFKNTVFFPVAFLDIRDDICVCRDRLFIYLQFLFVNTTGSLTFVACLSDVACGRVWTRCGRRSPERPNTALSRRCMRSVTFDLGHKQTHQSEENVIAQNRLFYSVCVAGVFPHKNELLKAKIEMLETSSSSSFLREGKYFYVCLCLFSASLSN